MTKPAETVQLMLPMPLGAQYLEELRNHPVDEVRALASDKEAEAVFEAVSKVMSDKPSFGFMHSALCSMSLPVKRPADQYAPVIRKDGNYTLIIRPMERMRMVDGELAPVNLGVPFGAHARLVMLYIMTQAVKMKSREIFLGDSFSAWLRRMGIENTNSGGERASRTLVQEQVDRLMSCEWTIRFDQSVKPGSADLGKRNSPKARKAVDSITAFAVNDMRLANQYGGVATSGREFVSRFVLSEDFFGNLMQHSVPMNERAFVALKRSPTQMDLYTWLAYRLPRIRENEEVLIRWEDLAQHLGNESANIGKFRQTVRRAWQTVSGVYQQARHSVNLDQRIVRLRYAEPPSDGHMHKLGDGRIEIVSANKDFVAADLGKETKALPSPGSRIAPALKFPSGSIRWMDPWEDIAKAHGSNNDVDDIARQFRRAVGSEIEALQGDRLVSRFTKYCQAMQPPR
jgi:hypothetical protein